MPTFVDADPNRPGVQLARNPDGTLRESRANSTGSERNTQERKDSPLEQLADSDVGRYLRSKNLFPGAEPPAQTYTAGTFNGPESTDWRVRLSVPFTKPFSDSPLLNPLKETSNSLVWPYTPNVFVTHTANYNPMSPTHSNYPFYVYTNSQVDAININGEFIVENSKDAEYWIAAMHYLKSITKMAYGESSNAGAPPPVVKLNGYGDYVFNNVPVVVSTFNVTMPPDVDYLPAPIGPSGSWVPTRSEIAVTLMPQYSRDAVNRFSLDTFVNGGYILDNSTGYL